MLWLTETNNMAVILSHTAQTENFIMTRNNHHRQQQKSSKSSTLDPVQETDIGQALATLN